MPFDPNDTEDMSRLRRVIAEQRLRFQPYYDNRKVLLEALHDPCHQNAAVDTINRRPHNPLDKMVRILTRGIVDQEPTLRIVRSRNARATGMMKSQLTTWARQTRMATVLQDAFQEALLRWGIVYTGYETPESGPGMIPYAHVLDFDDYFIDTRGNDEYDIDFEGHRWARRLDHIQSDTSNDPNVVDRITESAKKQYRNKITTLYTWVDLVCVWLPQEGVELTLIDEWNGSGSILEPLRVKPYVGPPPGPYVRLSLGNVRGTMVPVSRMSMLYDLHEFISRAYRIAYEQADESTEFYAYAGESERDAEKHRTAQRYEYVRFDNPNGVVKQKKGGVDPGTLGTAIHADGLFDSDAGNLQLLGGLGPSAPTFGQERGLGAGVAGMVDEMKGRVNKLAKRLYETAAWYIAKDPLRQEKVEWTTPNGNTVESDWTPETGTSVDQEAFEIIPGSMVSRSAEGQLQFLTTAIQTIASTFALPGEEPPVFRHRRFREIMAELGNGPEIAELFGEASDASSVVPGVEQAAQFAQRPGRSSGGGGAPQQNKTAERMIFSGGRAAE